MLLVLWIINTYLLLWWQTWSLPIACYSWHSWALTTVSAVGDSQSLKSLKWTTLCFATRGFGGIPLGIPFVVTDMSTCLVLWLVVFFFFFFFFFYPYQFLSFVLLLLFYVIFFKIPCSFLCRFKFDSWFLDYFTLLTSLFSVTSDR